MSRCVQFQLCAVLHNITLFATDFHYIDLFPDPTSSSCFSTYNRSTTGSVTDRHGGWHHLAVTWQAQPRGLTRIFIDGTLRGEAWTGAVRIQNTLLLMVNIAPLFFPRENGDAAQWRGPHAWRRTGAAIHTHMYNTYSGCCLLNTQTKSACLSPQGLLRWLR